MKKNNFRHSRSGFTLVELLIAMTIFLIMSAMTILIYFHISENSRRLALSREISETARQITERLSQDVRAEGIFLNDEEKFDNAGLWKEKFLEDYKNSGSEVLPIGKTDENKIAKWYAYGKKTDAGGLEPCSDADKNDIDTHCGLYLRENNEYYNLVDAFRSDEKSKRVKITDLRFFVTGDDYNTRKATLKMTLELMRRDGVPPSLVRATKMEVQTTFSERPYKIQ